MLAPGLCVLYDCTVLTGYSTVLYDTTVLYTVPYLQYSFIATMFGHYCMILYRNCTVRNGELLYGTVRLGLLAK
jgi:hypothetical protein